MMLKKLFDFKGSKLMIIARIILLVSILAAIVITAFGIKEILDVPHMKEILDAARPTMGQVALFLVKKYLVWALPVLFAGIIAFVTMRYVDNKSQA